MSAKKSLRTKFAKLVPYVVGQKVRFNRSTDTTGLFKDEGWIEDRISEISIIMNQLDLEIRYYFNCTDDFASTAHGHKIESMDDKSSVYEMEAVVGQGMPDPWTDFIKGKKGKKCRIKVEILE